MVTVPMLVATCTSVAAQHAKNPAALRAQGPAALDALLLQYDRAAPDDRAALAAQIDEVAGQRYATVSRLYWYTDLAQAQQAARELHRPILALRLLGDLREDLSCANSRLFRATLYANSEVAALLRNRFVLYWSSERPVPKVTIDFGDGRKLVRTTTGNSAHYVLDADGHVLDVLPGLYAPRAFAQELTTSLAFADQVRGLPDAARVRATVAHHAAALALAEQRWQQLGPYMPPNGPVQSRAGLGRAQALTVSKARIEVPDLVGYGLLPPGNIPDDSELWIELAARLWGFALPDLLGSVAPTAVLDDTSRALVAQLHEAGRAPLPDGHPLQLARRAALHDAIARLEQHILADSAMNELRLRPAIHRRIAERADTDFATLNAWIYEEVFATPGSDPWLGLLPRTDFSGLPGDGVVEP